MIHYALVARSTAVLAEFSCVPYMAGLTSAVGRRRMQSVARLGV